MVFPLIPILVVAGKALLATTAVAGTVKAKSIYDTRTAEELKKEIDNIIIDKTTDYENDVSYFIASVKQKDKEFNSLLTDTTIKIFNGVEPTEISSDDIPQKWKNEIERMKLSVNNLKPHISRDSYLYYFTKAKVDQKKMKNLAAYTNGRINSGKDPRLAILAITAQYSTVLIKNCFSDAKSSAEYLSDIKEIKATIDTKIKDMYDDFKTNKKEFENSMNLLDSIAKKISDTVYSDNTELTLSKKEETVDSYIILKETTKTLSGLNE